MWFFQLMTYRPVQSVSHCLFACAHKLL